MAETQRLTTDKGTEHDKTLLLRRASTFAREPSFSTSVDESKLAALSAFRPQLRDKFNVSRVEEVLQEIIQEFMKGKTYNADGAMEWSSLLSSLLNDRIKLFKFSRYKLVCLVTIGENIGGGILSGMKTQWDNSTDAYATYTYITVSPITLLSKVKSTCPSPHSFNVAFQFQDSLFVVGTVFGVYFY